jgi:hypothetical protein
MLNSNTGSVKMIKLEKLKLRPIIRQLNPKEISHLMAKMLAAGSDGDPLFLTIYPLIVIKREDGNYDILAGNHRYSAVITL